MKGEFIKVACIGLRNPDGSYQLTVPLYVKVKELNKNGMTDSQEEVIHRISDIVMKYYGSQLATFLANKNNSVEGDKIDG